MALIPTRPGLLHAEWLLIGAALLHLWEVEGHGLVWWGYGVFFAAIVAWQGLYSVLLPRRSASRAFLLAGIGTNAALVLLWTYTRFVAAVPVGPHRHLEPVGAVDLLTMALQTFVIVLLAKALYATYPRRAASRPLEAVPA